MKIVMIHGQNHKGSTYNIGRMIANKIAKEEDIVEFFLPRDLNHFCVGCYACIEDVTRCPFFEEKDRIRDFQPPVNGREIMQALDLEQGSLIGVLKEKIKDVSVTTDVICGFPSETEEEFKESLQQINIVLRKLEEYRYFH